MTPNEHATAVALNRKQTRLVLESINRHPDRNIAVLSAYRPCSTCGEPRSYHACARCDRPNAA